MPNKIGGLIWAGIGEGATSPHIPIYSGVTETPKAYNIGISKKHPGPIPFQGSTYDDESAYWQFRVLSNLVNLFYTATKDEVIPTWRNWENNLYKEQTNIEKKALELYKKNSNLATQFITQYSCDKADEAIEITKKLIEKLHTIIAHYNTPL
jgi:dipeptidase